MRRSGDVWEEDGVVHWRIDGVSDAMPTLQFSGKDVDLGHVQDLVFRWIEEGRDGFKMDRPFDPDDPLLDFFTRLVRLERGDEAAEAWRRQFLDQDDV